jgi:hypothetical protein
MSSLKDRQDAKVERMSWDGLRSWLVMQPSDRTYHWPDVSRCLVGLYLSGDSANPTAKANNPTWADITQAFEDSTAAFRPYPRPGDYGAFRDAVGADHLYQVAGPKPWTCGAALVRLDTVIGGEPDHTPNWQVRAML